MRSAAARRRNHACCFMILTCKTAIQGYSNIRKEGHHLGCWWRYGVLTAPTLYARSPGCLLCAPAYKSPLFRLICCMTANDVHRAVQETVKNFVRGLVCFLRRSCLTLECCARSKYSVRLTQVLQQHALRHQWRWACFDQIQTQVQKKNTSTTLDE